MTIWLDVTTVRGWGRPALGIVRVEAETARQFLRFADPGVRFCRFDLEVRSYYEVGKEELGHALARIDAGGQPPALAPTAAPLAIAPPPPPPPPPSSPPLSPAQRWKGRLRALLAPLPQPLQLAVLRFGHARKDALHGILRSYREARGAARVLWQGAPPPWVPVAVAPAPSRQAPDLLFGQHDVIVSLGLDWDQKDLAYLAGLKQRLQLKVLLMCYDIIPIRLPHLCVAAVAAKFPRYFLDVARCADQVLCISEYSRQDLRQYLVAADAPAPALDLVRLGCDIGVASGAAPASDVAALLERRFILFVSTIERRKNHETLYRAYTRLIDAGRSDLPMLVFVGMAGWGMGDLMNDMRLDARVQPYLRILNHVSDSDLALLYQHAYFTAYPSIYEGWGLPVAESLAYGKFCLASNAASIPEVGGALIEYVDPWDVPRWAERLQWYIDHPEEVRRREALIRSSYRATAWETTGATIVGAALALSTGAPHPA